MSLGTSLRVLASDRVWRLLGSDAAGRAVASTAVESPDEDASTLAAMLLVRGGDRAVPLLAEMVADGQAEPVMVDVLASIGTPGAMALLGRLVDHDDPDVAAAARSALGRARPPEDPDAGPGGGPS